jgi:Icc-related predicted phosphoesterase
MRFVCVADIHGSSLALSQACHMAREHNTDAILIAGDICLNSITRHFIRLLPEMAQYARCPIICVAGNHDYWNINTEFPTRNGGYYIQNINSPLDKHVICLVEGTYILGGVKIWGSPYVDNKCGKKYNWTKPTQELWDSFDKIPSDTNILLTHECSFGYGDMTHGGDRIGSESLTAKVNSLPDLKLHVYGHNHKAGGVTGRYDNGATWVNAACHDEDLHYQPQGIQLIEI